MPGAPKRKTFLALYSLCFTRSSYVFESLLQDKRRLRFGLWSVSLVALFYTLVYVCLIFGGGYPSTFTPWLNIPSEQYYKYNVYLVAPSMFMSWILAAGVVQLLSRLFNGEGSFEDTLVVLAFGISVASWSTLLHDLLSSFLGALHIIDQGWYEHALNSPTIWRSILWTLFAIYLFWFNYLFTVGIGKVQGLKRAPAFILGLCGFIVYQLIFVIFNR